MVVGRTGLGFRTDFQNLVTTVIIPPAALSSESNYVSWAPLKSVYTASVPWLLCGTQLEKRGTPFLRRQSLPMLPARLTIMSLFLVPFLRRNRLMARRQRRRAFLFWTRAAGTGSSGTLGMPELATKQHELARVIQSHRILMPQIQIRDGGQVVLVAGVVRVVAPRRRRAAC